MTNETFHKVKIYLAIVAFVAAIIVGSIALFLPDLKEEPKVDLSVLWFTSQLLLFCSAVLHLNLSLDVQNLRGHTKPKEDNKEDNAEQESNEE